VFQDFDQWIVGDDTGEERNQSGAGAVAAGVDDPRAGVGCLEPIA
jgi:hypothetical protein